MKKINLKKIKIFVMLFAALTSCASQPAQEVRPLSFKAVNTSSLKKYKRGSFEYSQIIYTDSKMPLEDFFSGLTAGRFKEAVSNIDITYHPSNIDNDIVKRLVQRGLTPVFLRIQNTGQVPAKLELKNFILKDRGQAFTQVSKQDLPSRISHFSAENAASNIVNITGGVLIVVAVIFVVLAGHGSNNIDIPSGSEDIFSMKSTTVDTKVDYGNLLLADQELQPNQSVEGLLFFQSKNSKPPLHPELQFN